MLKSFIASLMLSMSFISFHVIVSSSEIEQSCLNIICKVSSNCDADRRCLGTGSAHCGPFQISLSYWRDSGSLGDSFESCAFNLSCSKATVANYMVKHAKDCNGDAIIDCADYAAIHKAGPGHCDDHWVPKSAFMQSFFALSGRDAEASESNLETSAPVDPFHGDLRDFRRVVTRNHPTPRRPRRRQNPGPDIHDIVTALGPWVVDAVAGSRRVNRRPGNEVQPPRRRRVRPHDRPIPTAGTVKPPVTQPATTRPTRPPSGAVPTRRRSRPTVTAITTHAPPSPSRPEHYSPTSYGTSPTIPWWKLATSVTAAPTGSSLPTTRRVSVTMEPMRTTSTTIATSTTSTTSTTTTSPHISRGVSPYLTEMFTSTTSRPPTHASTSAPAQNQTTTLKPNTKPTFNPNRVSSSPPSVNDVEVSRDVPAKSNNTVKEIPLSTACMECLCMASSGCNFDANLKCYGEEECGPYRIDYAYWYEAGFPGYKGSDDDFAQCAKNRTCAEKAVLSYIKNNSRDCNQDGIIDCLDYAALHKAGPEACNTDWMYDSKFWTAFTSCYGFEEKEMHKRRRRRRRSVKTVSALV